MTRVLLGGVVLAFAWASCAHQGAVSGRWASDSSGELGETAVAVEGPPAPQQEPAAAPVPDAAGDQDGFWTRSELTGDWWGARTALADTGVKVRADITTIYQDVFEGGLTSASEVGTGYDLWVDLDTDKLGLWQGGFLKTYIEGRSGDSVNDAAGSFLAVNGDALFPERDKDTVTLTSLTYTQFLSHTFGVFFGKVEVLEGDKNTFAHGRSKTNFINFGFVYNPVAIWTVPYSGLGGGFFVMDGQDLLLTVTILDSEGQPGRAGFDTLDDNGTTFNAEARLAVSPMDLSGHQLLGAIWSNRKLLSLDQDPLPPLDLDDSSWSVYYNFDQYLMQESDDPEQGVGVFGRLGVSDGDPNPVEWFASFGIGGQGVFPGRDQDTFGIGYYHLAADERAQPFFAISDTNAYEVFYNFEVTPWLHVTPDLQVIDSELPGVDTTWVGGIRGHLQF